MIRFLRLHGDAAKTSLLRLLKQPVATLLILLMLSIAMTLPLVLYLGVESGRSVLGRLNESPQITLYLTADASDDDKAAVSRMLDADSRVAKYDFIDKAAGLKQLQNNMGGQDLVSMLDENPLPDVYVVTPKPEAVQPETMQQLQQDLAALPTADNAQMDAEWLQTLYRINDFLKKTTYFFAITLGLAFVLAAHNTIRLQILGRKEEIEITKLLGAPSSFIRRPFLWLAAWQSLAAAGISLLLCRQIIAAAAPQAAQIFQPYGLNIVLRYFTAGETLTVLAGVSALGIAGAWLAARRPLSDLRADK